MALTREQARPMVRMVDSAADVFADMEEHNEADIRRIAELVRGSVRQAKADSG